MTPADEPVHLPVHREVLRSLNSSAMVTRIKADSGTGAWRLTIRRTSRDSYQDGHPPDVNDLPPDVQAALLSWLADGHVARQLKGPG